MKCGLDCRYAEVLAQTSDDWVWCTRPGASVRLVHLDRECDRYNPPEDPSVPATSAPASTSSSRQTW